MDSYRDDIPNTASAKAEQATEKMATNVVDRGRKIGDGKGDTNRKESKEIIGITVPKASNFSQWYQELVLKAELVEYYDISGFHILRPTTMYIWNTIRAWFQERIEQMGVEEASFPMFLTSKSLEREKEHVEGFAPELAWVTKAGEKELEAPVAIRPTSEAVMYICTIIILFFNPTYLGSRYPYYARWIRSHRDLPLRLNQWNSVVSR